MAVLGAKVGRVPSVAALPDEKVHKGRDSAIEGQRSGMGRLGFASMAHSTACFSLAASTLKELFKAMDYHFLIAQFKFCKRKNCDN